MKNNDIYEIMAEVMGVITHPRPIFLRMPKLIFLPPLANPIPITAPTTACELETGTKGKEGKPIFVNQIFKFSDANKNKTVELESTTIKAAIGDILYILLPTVIITCLEYVNTPTDIAIPPNKNNCWVLLNVNKPAN